MSTLLAAAGLQKAPATTGTTTAANPPAGPKANVHTHSSGASLAASNGSVKTSEFESLSEVFKSSSSERRTESKQITKSSSYHGTSISLTEEHQRILQRSTSCFGDALSQVPWMKFRLVAEPNMEAFASDIRLRTFVQEITDLTVSIVTKQCNEKMEELITELSKELTSSMKVRTELIVGTIVKQMAAVCLEDTITTSTHLAGIKDNICFPRHSDGCGGCCDEEKHRHHHNKNHGHKHHHPHHVDAHGHLVDARGHHVDASGHHVDAHGHHIDGHGPHVDALGHRVDTHGHHVDAHGHHVDANGAHKQLNGHSEPNKQKSLDNKADTPKKNGGKSPIPK